MILVRLLAHAATLWMASQVVPGISYAGDPSLLLVVSLVFGLVNAVVRPLVKLLTLPVLILTLGLFTFVINAWMLWLTGYLSDWLGLGFHVGGFVPAFVGGLLFTAVNLVLALAIERDRG